MQNVIERLINALGRDRVITSNDVLRKYSRDFWPPINDA